MSKESAVKKITITNPFKYLSISSVCVVILFFFVELANTVGVGTFKNIGISIICLETVVIIFLLIIKSKGKIKKSELSNVYIQFILFGLFIFLFSAIRELVIEKTIFFETIKYSLYLIIPPTIVLYSSEHWNDKETDACIDIIFWIYFFEFIITNIGNFTFANIASISFWSSTSSVFESDIANYCVPLLMYYKINGNKSKSIICLLMGMLSFKRLSFILLPLVFFLTSKRQSKKLIKKEIKNKHILIIGIIFCLIPVLIVDVFTINNIIFLSDKIGLDLVTLSTGRLQSFWIMDQYRDHLIGYGATAKYIFDSMEFSIQNIAYFHCDCVSFYWECGFLYFCLPFLVLKMGRENIYSFLLSNFLMFLISTTHWLDVPTAMIIFCLTIEAINKERDFF